MRKVKKPDHSSERRNWGNIFNLLVQMVKNQQNQLHSFAGQHKLLEDRFRMQHERWASDVRTHKDQISQMKGLLMFEEKKGLLEAAKADLTLGFKHREASMLKWVLEHTEDELVDFKACYEYLSRIPSVGQDQGTVFKDSNKRIEETTDTGNKSTRKSKEREKCSGEIKDELSRLKGEYDKLALEKSSELAALLSEKKFVWNQYNIMENDYSDKLRSKEAEVEKANEKIRALVSSMEQLQSENSKKDRAISRLESKVADMEAETKGLNNQISILSEELESVRKFRNNQVAPVLKHCTEGTKTSDSGIIKSSRRRNVAPVLKHCTEGTKTSDSGIITSSRRRNVTFNIKNEICTPDTNTPSKFSDKDKKSLKRKGGPVPPSETPKLFSSSFKVPKLKAISVDDR